MKKISFKLECLKCGNIINLLLDYGENDNKLKCSCGNVSTFKQKHLTELEGFLNGLL